MRQSFNRTVGTVFAMFLLFPLAHAQTSMTLERCVEAALQDSPLLEARRAETRAARHGVDAMRGERLPSLSLNGSYQYQSKTQEITITPPVPNAQATTIEFGDGDAVDANLTLRAPLFAGGSLRARQRAALHASEAAGFDVASDSLEVLYQVRRAYFSALGAEENLRTVETLISRLKRHVAQVQTAIDNGVSTPEALVAAKARLVEARAQREQASAIMAVAQQQLGHAIGQPDQRIAPDGRLDQPLPQVERDAVSFNRRPSLQAVDRRLERLDAERRAVEGAFWPMVNAQASYHYADPGIDPVANEWMHYGTAGVQLTWTLWDWNTRSHRSQQVAATSDALLRQRDRITESFTAAEANAQRQMEAARRAMELSEERLELETETLRYTRARYEQGRATETEYLDRQDALSEAETALARARVNLRLAEVDVLKARGY
ncbi:hypothetical protein GF324_04455 [bacterium]|nr:hypothetical protein [bacterium]